MGRTLPTFNSYLEAEYDSWRPYRRALRKEDQEAFDALFRAAKQHVAESSHAVRAIPFEAMILSMLLEHEKRIRELLEERGAEKIAPPTFCSPKSSFEHRDSAPGGGKPHSLIPEEK